MTLEEAYQVATEIEANARFAVVAIGRFELIADLVDRHAGAFPWGVSIVSRVDQTYKAVCRTRDEVNEFVLIAPQPKRKPKPRPSVSNDAAPKPAPAKPADTQAVFAFD